ncbi:MAG: hypothetical protein V1824_00805 [archaeon]
MKIFIASSRKFFSKLTTIKFNLDKAGHETILPSFELGKVSAYANRKQLFLKKDLLLLEKADAILVCNFKNGKLESYIGETCLIYLAIAFYLQKKVYLLYNLPESKNKEELIGINPICLNGDLKKLK